MIYFIELTDRGKIPLKWIKRKAFRNKLNFERVIHDPPAEQEITIQTKTGIETLVNPEYIEVGHYKPDKEIFLIQDQLKLPIRPFRNPKKLLDFYFTTYYDAEIKQIEEI